jgi:hypothetical protein
MSGTGTAASVEEKARIKELNGEPKEIKNNRKDEAGTAEKGEQKNKKKFISFLYYQSVA